MPTGRWSSWRWTDSPFSSRSPTRASARVGTLSTRVLVRARHAVRAPRPIAMLTATRALPHHLPDAQAEGLESREAPEATCQSTSRSGANRGLGVGLADGHPGRRSVHRAGLRVG